MPELEGLRPSRLRTYRLDHEGVADAVARNLRSFMPANSRIIPNEFTKSVTVTDPALNLRKLVPLIRHLDQKPSEAVLRDWKERKTQEDRLRREAADHPSPH